MQFNAQINALSGRLAAVEARMDAMETRLQSLEAKFETRFDPLMSKVIDIDNRQTRLER